MRNMNIVFAAYTTVQTRLKLYKHLDALGDQVLYYDTDSVLYVHKRCVLSTYGGLSGRHE